MTTPAPAFRFARGQLVRWTIEAPPHQYAYRILGRRYWEYGGGTTVIDYQVARVEDPAGQSYFAHEHELVALEEA